MFKGTNKFWKGLALLLVLCMLPTVALAEGEATKVIVTATDNSVADSDAVKVTATVETEGDITILALRGGEGFAEGTTSSEASADASAYLTGLPVDSVEASAVTLKNSVVYIDQETAVDNGKGQYEVTFEFIPRSNGVTARGGYINIFFGGENVNTLAVLTVEKLERAPKLGKMDWFLGEALTFDVTNLESGTAMEAEKRTAWVTGATAEVTFADNSTEDIALTAESITFVDDKYILSLGNTLEGKEIKSVKITDANNEYDPAEYTQTLKQDPKTAGTVTAPAKIAAGVETVITVAKGDSVFGDEWLSKLNDATTEVKIGDNGITYSYVDGEFKITANDIVKGEFTIAVKDFAIAKVDNVEVVTAPQYAADEILKAEVDKLVAKNVDGPTDDNFYGITEGEYPSDAAKKDQMYGKRYVDISGLPAVGADYGTVAWSWTDNYEGDETEMDAKDLGDGKYELPRSADADIVYTLTGKISKGSDEATVTKEFTVMAIGVAGVDVTVDLKGGAAKGATITLKQDATTVATFEPVSTWEYSMREPNKAWTFKATGVPSGTYTMVIERSGYLTRNITVTVGEDALAIPAQDLLFGDLTDRRATGTPDGIIELSDFNALCLVFNPINDVADAKYDMDGNGKADLTDFNRLCLDFMQKYPETSYPVAE